MGITDRLFQMVEDGKNGLNIGLDTGIPKLNSTIGGWQRQKYYCIFGGTSSGKTSFVLYSLIYRSLMDNFDEDVKIVYYSLEMSAEILFSKLLSLYAYEQHNVVLSSDTILSFQESISNEYYDVIKNCKDWLKSIESKFIIYDGGVNARILYATMKTHLDKWGSKEKEEGRIIYTPHKPNGSVFVVLDHIGLVKTEEGRTLKQEIDLTSKFLVTLRKVYGISPIVLMQQNRDASSMDRRKFEMTEPTIHDLKNTNNVGEDCDIAIAVYYPNREKISNYRGYKIIVPNGVGFGEFFRSLVICKNRFGVSNAVIATNFFGEIGLFKELPKGDQITNINLYIPPLCYTNVVNTTEEKKDEIQKEKNKQSYTL